MRVRTAIGITAGIVAAQIVTAWLAADAWHAFPERRWAPVRWHIELGNLSEALAAFAGAGAAFAALWIAGRDRRDRRQERQREEATVARLVRLEVEALADHAALSVQVRNFGPLPVLDVSISEALWTQCPDARVTIARRGRGLEAEAHRVLRPCNTDDTSFEERVWYDIQFTNLETGRDLLPIPSPTIPRSQQPFRTFLDLTTVVVKVQFTTADGNRWETANFGASTGETTRVSFGRSALRPPTEQAG